MISTITQYVIKARPVYLILLLMVSMSYEVSADRFNPNSDLTFSYDDCNGNFTILFAIKEDETSDDYWDDFAIYIKEGSNYHRFIKFDRDNNSGSFSFDGQNEKYNVNTYGHQISYSYDGKRKSNNNSSGDDNKWWVRVILRDISGDLLGSNIDFSIKGTHRNRGASTQYTYFYYPGDSDNPQNGNDDNRVYADTEPNTTGVTSMPSISSVSVAEFCNKIEVEWSDPTRICNNSSKNKIEVHRRDNGGAETLVSTINYGVEKYTDTNVQKGHTYTYRIKQRFSPNSYRSHTGPFSNTSNAGSIIQTPASPTISTISNNNCQGIQINYTGQSGPNLEYRIVRRLGSEPWRPYQEIESNLSLADSPYLDQSVDPGKTYVYRVRLINECGDYRDSDPKSGIQPSIPAAPVITSTSVSSNAITLNWSDNSSDETEFVIERTSSIGVDEFTASANATTFVDHSAVQCRTYTYRIQVNSTCFSNGPYSDEVTTIIGSDLDETFDDDGFIASKGYYSDKVELTWTNNNESQTSTIKIYRRVLESGDDFVLLTTLSSSSGIYNDLYTEAGELYEYEILAEGLCGGQLVESNRVRTIGFRRKSGIVSGKVTYSGGTAVPNVKISAGDPNNNTYPSLLFDQTDTARIDDPNNINIGNETTIETWIKTHTHTLDYTVVERAQSFGIEHNASTNEYQFYINTQCGAMQVATVPDSLITINEWAHIATSLVSDTMYIYINGDVVSHKAINCSNNDIIDNTSAIDIGPGFSGLLKELRIWSKGKSSDRIKQDYTRFLAGNEEGLLVYLNAGEGKGMTAYDGSRAGTTFNKNHATLSHSGMWHQTDSPPSELLSIAAFTDDNGNYNLLVPYSGAGQNFTLTPILGIHSFDPSTRPVFVGDGSSVLNGIDFEDISSFRVTGTVLFQGMTCPSEDVFVKVDGEIVVQEGQPVTTDVDGNFDLRVPIGQHYISLEKNGHVFAEGRFPSEGRFDFQDDLFGLQLIDSTLKIVRGKVVGGDIEGDKKVGFGLSKNNVGIARITFDPQKTCGWIIDEQQGIIDQDTVVITDTLTGEYSIALPPLKYVVSEPEVLNNSLAFDGNQTLDLSNIPFAQTETDTITLPNNGSQVDSVNYHKILSFTYKSNPVIELTALDGSDFTGDSLFIFDHTAYQADTINITQLGLPHEVFTQNRLYSARLATYEEYVNMDGPVDVIDIVPVTKGTITINNELAVNETQVFNIANFQNYDGDTIYSFVAGQPIIAEDLNTPANSFTKPLKLDLLTGSKSASWQPNGDFFRGYIMGVKDVEQSDFATQGPELVDYILRDPPGSQSYSERTLGTTTTTENSWEWNVGGGVDIDANVFGGLEFNLGIGYSTATEIQATVNIGLSMSASGGEGQTVVESVTNESTWATSADPLLAGAQSDLFIGSSRNYIFGIATAVQLVPSSVCSNALIECLGTTYGGYRLATQKSLSLAQGDFETEFIYTASHIETYEIPQLTELRNNYFNDPRYQSNLASDHPCFGLNNDDPLFGTASCPNTSAPSDSDPFTESDNDRNGPSYTFSSTQQQDIDSIRVLNQQIRLWKEALAKNEREKAEAVDVEANYSFAGGGASFSRTQSNTSSFTESRTIEVNFTESLAFKVGGKVAGAGFEDTYSVSLTQNRTQVDQTTTDSIHTISYTIADDSEWDDFTFDVYPGSESGGPIFKTLAGRTSCPHEDKVVSQYHQPGTVLSPGTIQLEQPDISLSPSILYNVPQDESAVLTMTLTNNNQVGEGWEYATQLINTTNPNSAAVNVGSSDDLTNTWVIPAQASISRDIFVDIGSVYDYDSLLIVMHSTCQYQQGLSAEKDIVDSAYFSVHFIPECTDVELTAPDDKWVVNNSYNDELEIEISGYDINYLNLESISFDYKPSASSNWITEKTMYYDTTGMNDSTATPISRANPTSRYTWDLSSLPDGAYDLRARSTCALQESESAVLSGYIDTTNPEAFGTPSPADGVLDPSEDITIRFNETINEGLISNFNIDVRGYLNGSEQGQQESLSFDGSNDMATVPEYQLQKRSFSIEFWARRAGTSEEVILSQGVSASDQLVVGFDENNQLFLQLQDQVVAATSSTTDNGWHSYAVTYDRDEQEVSFFRDNTPIGFYTNVVADYTSSGTIVIGKNSSTDDAHYLGALKSLRLWSSALSLTEISAYTGKSMSGREAGLIGCWDMDDAYGDIARDKVRGRHMQLDGPTWNIEPASHSYQLDGVSDYLVANNVGELAISTDQDMTIEGWFKAGASAQKMTILSNGIPSTQAPSLWAISLLSSGELEFANNGQSLVTSVSLNDDDWHHFAIVINRGLATDVYINGELVNTTGSAPFSAYGSSKLAIGALAMGGGNYSQYLAGHVDDIRIWNLARKPEQIARDSRWQLRGDEPGLLAYYPFDEYIVQQGVPILSTSLQDQSPSGSFHLSSFGGNHSTTRPPVRLPRRIQQIPFTYLVNNDEIFIQPNIEPAKIENVTLDITVKGIQDLAGNYMPSPETWIAYIDKNQVFWEEEYIAIEKDYEGTRSFQVDLRNTGGQQEQFSLSNIPSWLSVSPQSGTINPNSTKTINFTINSGVDIGKYEQDILVSTNSFGYNEKLLLDLDIIGTPPDWEVDIQSYSYGMNIIGQLKINDVISTDVNDMVSVWIDNELRGVCQVEYDENSGKYLVFLTIGSNTPDADGLEFRAWDASEDRVLSQLSPATMTFDAGGISGTRSVPIVLEATALQQLTYDLSPGWNWVSFPLASPDLTSPEQLFDDLGASSNDFIKSKTAFNIYNGTQWIGDPSLSIGTNENYKIKVDQAKSFTYEGIFIDPATEPIDVIDGWNWIGVKSLDPVDINTALSSLDWETGDLIKGQRNFALYEEGYGWGGNLEYLEPQKGYKLLYHKSDSLIYPSTVPTPKSNGLKHQLLAHKKAQKAIDNHGNYQPGQYPNTMSLIANVNLCSGTGDISDYYLAAYVNGECRGITEAYQNTFYLSIEGNSGEQLTFRLIHKQGNGQIGISETMTFYIDHIAGMPSSPMVLNCDASSLCAASMMITSGSLLPSVKNYSFAVSDDISAEVIVQSDMTFEISAGQEIELLPGFEVKQGGVLELIIRNCIQRP